MIVETVTCSQCGLTTSESECASFLGVILCRNCMKDLRLGKAMRDKLRPVATPIPSSGQTRHDSNTSGPGKDTDTWSDRNWLLVWGGLLVVWVAIVFWIRGQV